MLALTLSWLMPLLLVAGLALVLSLRLPLQTGALARLRGEAHRLLPHG